MPSLVKISSALPEWKIFNQCSFICVSYYYLFLEKKVAILIFVHTKDSLSAISFFENGPVVLEKKSKCEKFTEGETDGQRTRCDQNLQLRQA